MTVLILEEHSSVLPEWWGRNIRARTLIYLDAHLDLQCVSRQRLDALRQCTTKEAVKRLEKRHHLLPDRSSSYSLEDFLHPAHRLGLIERLIWVAPPHVETAYSPEILGRLQQMDGVLPEDLGSFRRRDGCIEGRLLGLPITLCGYRQLESMALPADSLIDIDTDYFVTVPGDAVWIDPRTVFDVLNRLPLQPELITLSRSVSSGFTPLRYRFLADYLAALWEHRRPEAAHYQRLLDLDGRLRAGDARAAALGCRRELESHPGCAATHFLLGLSEHDPAPAAAHQRRAETLCPGYRPSTLRAACEIPNRRLPADSATVLSLEQRLAESREEPEQLALAQVALGLIYCACGQVDHAWAHYQRSTQHLGHHPELALEIGKLLLRTPRAGSAVALLQAALEDDKTRAAAHVFLAHFHRGAGALAQAIEHLEAARGITPAWLQLLSMLAELQRQQGNTEKAQALLAQYRQQQSQSELLVRNLAVPRPAGAA